MRELLFCVLCLLSMGCVATPHPDKLADIAFLPDIHFHDVYGHFEKGQFKGIETKDGKSAVIRSMSAQLRSTRLFNENYFALRQALDDVVGRGVKWVVLPGDFTDDGQPIHVRGLVKILDEYEQKHGLRFFIANGNHDPVRPFDSPGGEPDFLDEKGREVAIYSTDHPRCHGKNVDDTLICADDVGYSGYETLLRALKNKGFFPREDDLYWASPFSEYSPLSYQFDKAQAQAVVENRQWPVCHPEHDKICVDVIDSSYVVEPVHGLWLLAIDANVYPPKVKDGKLTGFSGAGNQGYNGVVKYKPQLLQWIKEVARQAKQHDKTLIAFSHYPMAPFFDGQEQFIQRLLGKNAFQMIRSPTPDTVQALINTGLTFHVGGHMHINDTQSLHLDGKTLVNIQAPSLAAYRPAYKHLVVLKNGKGKLMTRRIDEVDGFDAFFSLYRKEHDYLRAHRRNKLWNEVILTSKNFHQFADFHLRELARLRFIPKEWAGISPKEQLSATGLDVIGYSFHNKTLQKQWLKTMGLGPENFSWTILDLIHDLYRYRNAGALAHQDVTLARNRAYDATLALLTSSSVGQQSSPYLWLSDVITLLQGLRSGEPDDQLWLDLHNGVILPD